jgi:hypothetical protein
VTTPADLLIINANVFTADPANPTTEALAVKGNRIAFVGSNADVLDWRGPAARIIDAAGRTLMPGFIDSHFHLLGGSLDLRGAQLGEVQNLDSLVAVVREFADHHPNDPILAGSGLRYAIGGASRFNRHLLDAIIPDRPLILLAYDHHTAWANTSALTLANLLKEGRAAGPNSEIVLGDDGLASGELREGGAFGPLLDRIPPPDASQKRVLLHQGLALAAKFGLTSIHNMDGDADQIALYAALEDAGELTLRVYVPYSIRPDTTLEALAEAAAMKNDYQSEMVRGGAAKFFMDGVIESYTSLLVEAYADQPSNFGGALYSAEHFTHIATECDRLGLQIFVHATGDGAVRRALDGFEAIARANGKRDSRHRVEHIELIHPDDLPRFAELGVIASMQPLHCPLDGDGLDLWPRRVGPERWGRSFAWQSLHEAGARLVFGSDWPVVTQNSMMGVQAALNRQPWAEGLPHHRQTLANTLVAYTRDAAFAEFQEGVKGQLRVGMLADLVLLSEDIFAIPSEAIARVHPVLTMCDGRIVYEDL